MTGEFDIETVRNMTRVERTRYDAEVPARVIHFHHIRPNWDLSPNCRLPGHERANFIYVGRGEYLDWQENKGSQRPHPIVPGENYSCVILLCAPGKGAPLHAHTTEELFLALSGRWAMYWGENAEHETILETLDAISFPGPVMRGFRNVAAHEAYLLGILGGGSPPPPVNHPSVVRELDKLGLKQSWKENNET